MIREGILHSPRVNALSDSEEVFYRRLLSVADDYGLFDPRPGVMARALYPCREPRPSEADTAAKLNALIKAGLVALLSWEGRDVGYVARFRQRVRKKPLFGVPTELIQAAERELSGLIPMTVICDGHMTVTNDRHVITPSGLNADSQPEAMTVIYDRHVSTPAPLPPSPYSPPHPPLYTPTPAAPASAHTRACEPRRGNSRPKDAEEVRAYLASLMTLRIIPTEIPVCAEKFFDSMEAAGWVDTKGRNVWDWKAAARLYAGCWQNNTSPQTNTRKYYD